MIPGINIPFAYAANLLGASVDELKLLSSFLFSYPLAAALKRIPDANPWQKNVFIISVALFYLVGLFDLWSSIRTILISAGGTYLVSYYIDGSLMPWIAFTGLMSHMSVSHIIRQRLNDPTVVDVTGMQMVMVMKLSAFAWNVHDGRIKRELLTDVQKEKAIYKMPGFLDYTAWVLFFPSLFAGPAFDYNDYKRWIETTMFEVAPGEVAAPTRKGRHIPRSGTPASWKLAEGLFWIVAFLQLSGLFYPTYLLENTFWNYSFLRRIFYIYAVGFAARTKYYGVWKLTEGACILTGLGYNGIDPQTKKPKWDRLENVNPWGMETAQNARGYMENWNKNTSNWLRNYIYLRVTPKGKKPGFRATLATFATSAIWHGYYPGYYLTFIFGAFIQTAGKNFRRHLRPFFMTPDGKQPTQYKRYYDVLCWFVTQNVFSFAVLPFIILGFTDSLRAWATVYFYAIIGTGASMAFFASPAKKWLTSKVDKRNHPYALKTVKSETSMAHLGLLDTEEIDQAIDEIKLEVDERRRRGSKVEFPNGDSLKKAISQRVWINRNGGDSAGPGNPKINIDQVRNALEKTLSEEKKEL